jgi:hypothetical protein
MQVAQSKLWFKKGRAARQPITFMIGKPERDPLPGGNYRCPVTIRGLGKKRHVFGVDSLQSLMLAMFLINTEVNILCRQGYRFYMSKSGKNELDIRLAWQVDSKKLERLGRLKRSS